MAAVRAALFVPYRLYIYWITSSLLLCSKSISISGGSFLSFERKRAKSIFDLIGSTSVIP